MDNYTIAESCTLPSLGRLYEPSFDPEIRVRSMTTEDEMKRLSPSSSFYKTLCEILDDCIVSERLPISAYDMCLGDYQVLLHKVRVATYGAEYPLESVCPHCGVSNRTVVNLDQLETEVYSEDIEELRKVELPVSGKLVTLRLQTARMLDQVTARCAEIKKRSPEAEGDFTYLLTLAAAIDLVDGNKVAPHKLEDWLRKLPMRDTNILLRRSSKLNQAIGVKTTIDAKCGGCGGDYTIPFRLNSEFFGPSEG